LTLAALFVAVIAALGGGYRFSVGTLRVSVTSWHTPLLVAVAAGAIRHVLLRGRPLPRRLRDACDRLSNVDGWPAAWRPFVVTRAAVLAVGVLAVYTVGYPPAAPPYRISTSELVNLPMRWDAGWYIGIARGGYRWDPDAADQQQNVAFFPGYPVLVSLAGVAFGTTLVSRVLAASTLSHLAFMWSLIYLYRLAREQLGDASAAARAVLLLAAYPFSVFHGAIYTESLFLLGSLGAILSFIRGQWLAATFWGVLVGISRPNGFLLSATLLVLAVERSRAHAGEPGADTRARRAIAVGAPILGVVLFSIYVAILTGNPLQWSAQHAAWGRVYRGASPFLDAALFADKYGLEAYVSRLPYDSINGVAALVALALIVPVWRRLGLASAVFLASNLLPPLLMGGVMSIGRLTCTLFPMFIWLSARTGPGSMPYWMAAFAAGQSLAAVLFYTWRPLY
jgi:hypothetical protein